MIASSVASPDPSGCIGPPGATTTSEAALSKVSLTQSPAREPAPNTWAAEAVSGLTPNPATYAVRTPASGCADLESAARPPAGPDAFRPAAASRSAPPAPTASTSAA